jgi:hypothetical protein
LKPLWQVTRAIDQLRSTKRYFHYEQDRVHCPNGIFTSYLSTMVLYSVYIACDGLVSPSPTTQRLIDVEKIYFNKGAWPQADDVSSIEGFPSRKVV